MNTLECIEIGLLAESPDRFVLGCDEVGRGPLAGPVTAACVAFPRDLGPEFALFAELNDSKKLTAHKREALVPQIESAAAAFAVVDLPPEEIDKINILQASLKAMRIAVGQVIEKLNSAGVLQSVHQPVQKDLFGAPKSEILNPNVFVVVDGNKTIPELGLPQAPYVKGDARSWNIAAASILAKVHRDALMVEYDKLYPGYGFAKHAGYPTKFHRDAIKTLGFSPIHRRSFNVR